LGAKVSVIARVCFDFIYLLKSLLKVHFCSFQLGSDHYGKEYLKAFAENKVDTSFVKLTEGQNSGIAQITVADSGRLILYFKFVMFDFP